MITLDIKQGIATVGEYWGEDDDNPTQVIVELNRTDEGSVEVAFEPPKHNGRIIISVPVERLRKILR